MNKCTSEKNVQSNQLVAIADNFRRDVTAFAPYFTQMALARLDFRS